jgi:hypothetical protein
VRLRQALAIGVPLLFGGAGGLAYVSYRDAMAEAEQAWRDIASRAAPSPTSFDPALVAGEPEVARRYFSHAIAPGTPLASTAELEMRGTFLLGSKAKHQSYAMRARQILRPPFEFVWMPVLKSGAMTITGSDALVGGKAWTRFWLAGLIPVADARTSSDMLRSAAFRAAMEGLWVPSSLLPQNGVGWEQVGPDRARLTIRRTEPHIVVDLLLAEDGAVREVVGQRWSNANPEQRFRQQPFGGTAQGEAVFSGYRIPARLHVGNHYGTEEYLPFFQAEIIGAKHQ